MSYLSFANYLHQTRDTAYDGKIPPVLFDKAWLKADVISSWKHDVQKKSNPTPPIDYDFYRPVKSNLHVLLTWPVKVSVTIDGVKVVTLNLKDVWAKNEFKNVNIFPKSFTDLLSKTHYYGFSITDDYFNKVISKIYDSIVYYQTQSKVYPDKYYVLYSRDEFIEKISKLCCRKVTAAVNNNYDLYQTYMAQCPYLWKVQHTNAFDISIDANDKIFNDWTEYAAFIASQYNHGAGNSLTLAIAKNQYVNSTAFDIIRVTSSRITKSVVKVSNADWQKAETVDDKLQYLKSCMRIDNSWYTKSGMFVCCNHEYLRLIEQEPPTTMYDNNKICNWCNEVIESNMDDANAFAEGRIDISEEATSTNEEAVASSIDDIINRERLIRRNNRYNARTMYRLRVVMSREVTESDVSKYASELKIVRGIVDKFLRTYVIKSYKVLFEIIKDLPTNYTTKTAAYAVINILEHFNILPRDIKNGKYGENGVIIYQKISSMLKSYVESKINNESRIDTSIFRFIRNSQHIPVTIMYTLGDAYAVACVDEEDSVNFNHVYINPTLLSTEVIFGMRYYASLLDENFKTQLHNLFNWLNTTLSKNIKLEFTDRPIVINDDNLTLDKNVLLLKNDNPEYTNVDYYRMLSYFANCGSPSNLDDVTPNTNMLTSITKIGIIKLVKAMTNKIYNGLRNRDLTDETLQWYDDIIAIFETPKKLEELCSSNVYDRTIANLLNPVNIPTAKRYSLEQYDDTYRLACKTPHYNTVVSNDTIMYEGTDLVDIDANFSKLPSHGMHYSGKTHNENSSAFFSKLMSMQEFKITRFVLYQTCIKCLLTLYYKSMYLEDSMNALFVLEGFISDCRTKLRTTLNTFMINLHYPTTYEYVKSKSNAINYRIDSFSKEVALYLMLLPGEMYENMVDWIYTELDWRALVSITPTEYENILLATIKYNKKVGSGGNEDEDENEDDEYDIPDIIDDNQYDILNNNDDDVEAMDDGIRSLYSDDLIIENEGMY